MGGHHGCQPDQEARLLGWVAQIGLEPIDQAFVWLLEAGLNVQLCFDFVFHIRGIALKRGVGQELVQLAEGFSNLFLTHDAQFGFKAAHVLN